MRRIAFFIALLCATLTACEFEFSDNGKLDGFWQMTAADSVATGASVDMKSKRVYWSVQHNLLQAQLIDGYSVLFRFDNTGDSLLLSSPYTNDRDRGDTLVTDISTLRPLGVNSLSDRFRIVDLNASNMTLENRLLRLHFRKY